MVQSAPALAGNGVDDGSAPQPPSPDHDVVLVGIRKEIEAKQQLARDPHVAVIDLNLGKDGNGAGLQLVREMRASHPRIGAVICSQDGDDDSVADAEDRRLGSKVCVR